MFICPRCSQEFKSYNSLSKHTRTKYKLSGEALYKEYHNIPSIPLCKCGCGKETKWRTDRGYAEYVNGHNSIGESNPMYGQTHSAEARKSISKRRKEMFASGELTISSDIWSKAAKKVWERKGHKERMSRIRKKWIADNGFKCEKSNLEVILEDLMRQHNITTESQYILDGKYFDFWVEGTNILIEADGDFYHCNPTTKFAIPVYDIQKKNIENDSKKNQIAKASGYTLLRFWESDILNDPQKVVSSLLTAIKSAK